MPSQTAYVPHPMELRHFRYFLVLAEEKNFSHAAARLHIAQPALSRQIRSLEKELGCVLFTRLPRGAEPTPAGLALVERLKLILEDIESACAHVSKVAAGLVGTLRIGMNEIASGMPVVPQAIHSHRRAHANIELQLTILPSPEQLERLRQGSLDVGFLNTEPALHPDLRFTKLEDYTLLLAVPKGHRLEKRKRVYLRDLANESFVWIPRQKYPWIHKTLIDACTAQGFSPRIVLEVDGLDPQLNMLSTGMGVGFVHSTLRSRCRKNLVLKRVCDLHMSWPLYLAWRQSESSPVVNGLVRAVLHRLKEPAGNQANAR